MARNLPRDELQESLAGVQRGRAEARFGAEVRAGQMAAYRTKPSAFAQQVLGSEWWTKQEKVARAVASHRRVAVKSVNVALPAYDTERFAHRRAELYWGLRERLRAGEIALPQDERLAEELASLRYRITSRGQIQMESKEEMKRRGLPSPDRADMLALLSDGAGDALLHDARATVLPPSPARRLREEMADW